MTVHGELALMPPATEAEAAQALADFTSAYNKADKAYDPAMDAGRVTGPLGEINQAGLRARAVTTPGGNPNHRPLELTDARFVLPKKAGWPRWFLADTDSNRDTDEGAGDQRWLLVFVRNGPQQLWEAAHLVVLGPAQVPEFAEEGGYAVPVAADSDALAVAPADLGKEYVSFLKDGQPGQFTAGAHTSLWREQRQKGANRPGLATQYIDRAADQGDFAPLGLRTKDGGAFVFFATRFFERQTAAPGYRPKVDPAVKALLTGEVKNTVTKEWVSNQVALVKPAGTDRDGVTVAGRLQGVVGAQGS
ncbi:putative lipoprotein [Streptomyces zaomyceticus]|nr:putative lipoprotein [Streptomyces zaomyceticus]